MCSSPMEDAKSSRLEDLAERGNAEAQYELAWRFSRGRRSEDEPQRAIAWFERAASQGHPAALWRVATSFELCDDPTALYWIRRAAQSGYAPAQVSLASRHLNGQGVERNVALALQWLVKASEQGDPSASYKLGLLRDEGVTEGVDEHPAAYWYRRAADQYRDRWLRRDPQP